MNFLFGYQTVKPVKNVAKQGTIRFELHKKVQNSFAEGHTTALLFEAVKCPQQVNVYEWMSVHASDFYNRANIVFSMIQEECAEFNKKGLEQCTRMTAGPNVLYLWRDGKKYKKPTELCAFEYMNVALDWVEELISDEKLFPTGEDVSYPKTFKKTIKDLMKKLFRIFSHAMYSHFETLKKKGNDAQVNIWLKQFLCFCLEHRLLKEADLEPMKDWIQSHMSLDVAKFIAKKKKDSKASNKAPMQNKFLSEAAAPSVTPATPATPVTPSATVLDDGYRKREKSIMNKFKVEEQSVIQSTSSLTVEVVEAKQLGATDFSGASNLFVEIAYENQTISTQYISKTLNPEWKETFSFLVKEVKRPITFHMYDYNFFSKRVLIGSYQFEDMHFLLDEIVHDLWIDLKNKDQKPCGSLHLKLYYTSPESGVMDYLKMITTLDFYEPIQQFWSTLTPAAIVPLFDMQRIETNDKLWKAILFATMKDGADNQQRCLLLVKHVMNLEILTVSTHQTLFRSNTIASKLVSAYMNEFGIDYLKTILAGWVNQICTEDLYLEVDPRRFDFTKQRLVGSNDVQQNIDYNMKQLINLCNQLFATIINAVYVLPLDLRELTNHLKGKVVERFCNSSTPQTVEGYKPTEQIQYPSMGGLLFLRFICPAMLSPQKSGIYFGTPSSNASRTLLLCSKILQQLANDEMEFGSKESFMTGANEFLSQNREKLHQFFTKVSTIGKQSELASYLSKQMEEFKKEEAKQLWAWYTIHCYFFSNAKQMQTLLDMHPKKSHKGLTFYPVNGFDELLATVERLNEVVESMGAPPQLLGVPSSPSGSGAQTPFGKPLTRK